MTASARSCAPHAAALAALCAAFACGSAPEPNHTDPDADTLVIDVHAHVFNQEDLPIEGFLEHSVGAPRWVAKLIARVLSHFQQDAAARTAARGELSDEAIEELLLELVVEERPPEARVDAAELELDLVLKRLIEGQGALSATQRTTLRRLEVEAAQDDAALRRGGGLLGVVTRHVRWAHLLTRSTDELAKVLYELYPAVDLFTPLMMDMRMWFGDSPKPSRTMEQQFIRAEALIASSKGRIHPFVAFDPWRNLARSGESLALVESALERGFLGVKLYPPMGYRAWDNASIPSTDEDPRPPEAAQWDAELTKLYDLCAARGIPIAAHCSDPGAESFPGRGQRANPRHWVPVLERYRERGTPLRVNFNHAGGLEDVIVSGTDSWAWTLAALMAEHEHVYGDLGHLHEVLDPAQEDQLVLALNDLFTAFPVMKERLLFGTDWHLIVREPEHRAYLERHVAFFKTHFPELLPNYLGGNAMRYLGLAPGEPSFERLQDFYQTSGMTPPERWWPN